MPCLELLGATLKISYSESIYLSGQQLRYGSINKIYLLFPVLRFLGRNMLGRRLGRLRCSLLISTESFPSFKWLHVLPTFTAFGSPLDALAADVLVRAVSAGS